MTRSNNDLSHSKGRTPSGERRGQTLEKLGRAAVGAEELSLADLRPMSRLIVRTRNSVYRLVVLGPRPSVLVQGGRHFPEATEVLLCGSSLGRSLLKTYWIGVGFQMEMACPTRRIVTSPVCSIEVEADSVYGAF